MTSSSDTERWETKARENIDRWGNQTPTVLLLALIEEIAEVADEVLATADKAYEDDMAAQEAFHHLSEVRRTGFRCRQLLEDVFEDADGNPLPDDEVPRFVKRLDTDRVLDEVEDAAPLVYQLAWALEDGGRDD